MNNLDMDLWGGLSESAEDELEHEHIPRILGVLSDAVASNTLLCYIG